jgi:glutaredoxin|tara:strand:+ start:3260 stop:3523 length:264 start_codon:yes stop_codon:yes gene_type:complete
MPVVLPFDNGYFMYTKSNCKWCQLAKEKLPSVVGYNVDKHLTTDKQDFLKKVAEISGAEPTTFPMVFYNGIFLGGCTESLQHLELIS